MRRFPPATVTAHTDYIGKGPRPVGQKPGPSTSLWAKKVLLSGTHPNKSYCCPAFHIQRARRAPRGLDEKIPKKSGGGAFAYGDGSCSPARPFVSVKYPRGSLLAAPRPGLLPLVC